MSRCLYCRTSTLPAAGITAPESRSSWMAAKPGSYPAAGTCVWLYRLARATARRGLMAADKVAILVVNYNMPERTDALCNHVGRRVKWPHDLIVIDNGSDLVAPSQFTTLWLPENRQTTGGLLAGLRYADLGGSYMAYWFLITSAELIGENDPLAPMAQLLLDDPDAVGRTRH